MKKGFTLVELLAVIVIIGLVTLISVPNLTSFLKKSSEKITAEQRLSIENAARAWGIKNLPYDEENDDYESFVSLYDLKEAGLIEKKTFDNLKVNDKEKIGVCIKYENHQYVYTYTDNIDMCGANETE